MEQSIKIKIAGIEYPLKSTSPEMEQTIRLAGEAINDKLTAYDAKFPDKSQVDKLAFVALNEAMSRINFQRKIAGMEKESAKLQEGLESYLNSIKESGR